MKKVNKESRINDLAIDVVEYAFREWLIRQGVFVAFKKNYEFVNPSRKSFREELRLHIRILLEHPTSNLSNLVSSSFPFVTAPEGANFWRKQSDAWNRFCRDFRTHF